MKTIIICCVCFLITISSYAQTVIKLKSGGTAKGELVEKTDEYIKLDVYGIKLTYWMDEIESIESEDIDFKELSEVQSSSRVVTTLELSDKDIEDIKKMVEIFLSGCCNQDLNSIMGQISVNYYDQTEDGTIIDYAAFKSRLKKYMGQYFKIHIISCFSNLQVVGTSVEDDEVRVTTEWDWKAYNVETFQWEEEKDKKLLYFVKEDGAWKIIHWESLDKLQELNP